ncbi:contact-dependent growth inhibition system immunity protein [Actinoplanes sp. NPDC051494]|uniref:contact-dependent growth inhibition system immunity protein n=1 Tax=Actinoplanes sp. NPDC051494 TaxID=3363907 RepID=UPI00379F8E70
MSREQSLEQIENRAWGEAPADASTVVETVHRLRRKPIGALDVEDLRVLIGQRVGVAVLMPLALEVLELDPLAEGDYYPGDLLSVMLRLPAEYWADHPSERERLAGVARSVDPDDLEDDEKLREEITRF